MNLYNHTGKTIAVVAYLALAPQLVNSGQVSVINPASGSSAVVIVPQSSTPAIAPSVGGPTASAPSDLGVSLGSRGKDATTQNFIRNFDLSTLTPVEINEVIGAIGVILETKNLTPNKKTFLMNEITKLMELKAYRSN